MSFWRYKVADTGVAFSGNEGPYIMFHVGEEGVPPHVAEGVGAGKWRGVQGGKASGGAGKGGQASGGGMVHRYCSVTCHQRSMLCLLC